MHAIYSDTQYKNESKHSEMGPVRQNPIQKAVGSVHNVCALHCAQLLLHTTLHITDLIIFPLTLQTITTAPMMSIRGKGGARPCEQALRIIIRYERVDWLTNLGVVLLVLLDHLDAQFGEVHQTV